MSYPWWIPGKSLHLKGSINFFFSILLSFFSLFWAFVVSRIMRAQSHLSVGDQVLWNNLNSSFDGLICHFPIVHFSLWWLLRSILFALSITIGEEKFRYPTHSFYSVLLYTFSIVFDVFVRSKRLNFLMMFILLFA